MFVVLISLYSLYYMQLYCMCSYGKWNYVVQPTFASLSISVLQLVFHNFSYIFDSCTITIHIENIINLLKVVLRESSTIFCKCTTNYRILRLVSLLYSLTVDLGFFIPFEYFTVYQNRCVRNRKCWNSSKWFFFAVNTEWMDVAKQP